MPIVIEALNEKDFNSWIIEQKNKLAMADSIEQTNLIIE
jgi:heme/copper-type cytochrome/quinol oxidase subunit 2